MHQPRTAWPETTRASQVVAYEHLLKQYPRLSEGEFRRASAVPVSTVARWWRRFRRDGPHGLKDHRRRPQHSPRALPSAVLDIIRRVQHALGFGYRRLHAHLTAAGPLACSPSSVYRVRKRAGSLVTHRRRPKPNWPRSAKETPGERAQMDLKYLPEGRCQGTLIDDWSRTLAATVLTGRTLADVVAALPRLLAARPAPIQTRQTDNGSEFQSDFPAALTTQGSRHVHIRPRCPHRNGKVERVQRTCQEELFRWRAAGTRRRLGAPAPSLPALLQSPSPAFRARLSDPPPLCCQASTRSLPVSPRLNQYRGAASSGGAILTATCSSADQDACS